MNITQRLLLAFSLLFGAIILQAVLAISLLSGFQDRFEYVQANAIPSIKDLGKMIDEGNQLAITLYKHQSQTEDAKFAEVEKKPRRKPGADQIADRLLHDQRYL
ncbi:hypothetical protein OJE16_00465 [Pantoea tagorei]